MSIMLDTPEAIEAWRLLSYKARLSIEISTGLKFKDGSTYAYIKRTYGFKGNKQKVYDQYCAMLREKGILKDAE